MMYCDQCQEKIEPADDGFMEMTQTSNDHADHAPLVLIDVGPFDLRVEIKPMTERGDRSPDCGYHYHDACFANLLRQAIDEQYPIAAAAELAEARAEVDIVFADRSKRDLHRGPPEMVFIEVENMQGHSIKLGEWVEREDGYAALRIKAELPGAS